MLSGPGPPLTSAGVLFRQKLIELIRLTPPSEVEALLERFARDAQERLSSQDESIQDTSSDVDPSDPVTSTVICSGLPTASISEVPEPGLLSTPESSELLDCDVSTSSEVGPLISGIAAPSVPQVVVRDASIPEVCLLDLPNVFTPCSEVLVSGGSTVLSGPNVRPPPGFAVLPSYVPLVPQPIQPSRSVPISSDHLDAEVPVPPKTPDPVVLFGLSGWEDRMTLRVFSRPTALLGSVSPDRSESRALIRPPSCFEVHLPLSSIPPFSLRIQVFDTRD